MSNEQLVNSTNDASVALLLKGRGIIDAYRAEHAKGVGNTDKLAENIKALGFASIDDFFIFNAKANLTALMECYVLEQAATKCSEDKCPTHACGAAKSHNENACAQYVPPEVQSSIELTGKEAKDVPVYYGITSLRIFRLIYRPGKEFPKDHYKADILEPCCPKGMGFYGRKVKEPQYDWTWH